MANSVYSLVLSGAVVDAVDILAAQQGLSRSALVNHILAEYASVASPQQHRRDTLAALQSAAGENGLRTQAASSGSVTLRTSLRYKYNPALCYTVELAPGDETLGQLRVWLRSQNDELLGYFHNFFQLWHTMEQGNLPQPPTRKLARLEPKRYLRTLRTPAAAQSGDDEGSTIAAYIAMMDSCMGTFFANLGDAKAAIEKTTQEYLNRLPDNGSTREL